MLTDTAFAELADEEALALDDDAFELLDAALLLEEDELLMALPTKVAMLC